MASKDDLRGFWNPNETSSEVETKTPRYKYIRKKAKSKCHIIHPKTGITYCKFENGSRRSSIVSDSIPDGRRVCHLCERLAAEGKEPRSGKIKRMKTATVEDFYRSNEWARLRYEVLRDAKKCLCCGATKQDTRLTVDHIKSARRYPELRLDRGNLQVLCMLCNRGKGGSDETDFRGEDLNDVVFTELDDETRQGTKLN